MRRLGKKFRVLLACTLAVSACGGGVREQKATEYPVIAVSKTDRTLQTSYSAAIQGRQDIAIYPQVSGKITSVKVTEGQKVRKGQVLFIIDQVPYKAAYESALADYQSAKVGVETAQLNYDSDKKLYENKVVSAFELQTSENQLHTALATLAQAEAQKVNAENNLSYTEVVSPADGVVGTLPYREGTLVSASMSEPLTRVSDNSLMYVYFSLRENDVLSLLQEYGSLDKALAGMPEVDLKLNNGTIYQHKGKVASISGVINETTGSVQFRAEFPNPERILMSGGNGSVVFPDVYKDVIVIPQEATFQLQDQVFVYKIVDGKTESARIEIVPENDGREYIVLSGLEVGDKIIASGAGLLRAGMPVVEKLYTEEEYISSAKINLVK